MKSDRQANVRKIFEAVHRFRRGERERLADTNPAKWKIEDLDLPSALFDTFEDDPVSRLACWLSYLAPAGFGPPPDSIGEHLRPRLISCAPEHRQRLAVELAVAWGCGVWNCPPFPDGDAEWRVEPSAPWERAAQALVAHINSRLVDVRNTLEMRVTGYPEHHDTMSDAGIIAERLRLPLSLQQARRMDISWLDDEPAVALEFAGDAPSNMRRGQKRIFQVDEGFLDLQLGPRMVRFGKGSVLILSWERTRRGRDSLRISWTRPTRADESALTLYRQAGTDEHSTAVISAAGGTVWHTWACDCGDFTNCPQKHRLDGWREQFLKSNPANPLSLWSFLANAVRGRDKRPAKPDSPSLLPPPFAPGAFSVGMYYPRLRNVIPGESFRLFFALVRERMCPEHVRPYDGAACPSHETPLVFDVLTHRQVGKRRLILEGRNPPLHEEKEFFHCTARAAHFNRITKQEALEENVNIWDGEDWENYFAGESCPICGRQKPQCPTKLFVRTDFAVSIFVRGNKLNRRTVSGTNVNNSSQAPDPGAAASGGFSASDGPKRRLDVKMLFEILDEQVKLNEMAAKIVSHETAWLAFRKDEPKPLARLLTTGEDMAQGALQYLQSLMEAASWDQDAGMANQLREVARKAVEEDKSCLALVRRIAGDKECLDWIKRKRLGDMARKLGQPLGETIRAVKRLKALFEPPPSFQQGEYGDEFADS